MNKQELIDKYTAEISRLRPYCPNRYLISEQLKYDLYKEILEDLKQLDEPQKPVVPKFVADWIEKSTDPFTKAEKIAYLIKSKDGDSYYFCDWFVRDGILTQEQGEELFAWATRQSYETLLSLYNGYEVEKEPKYIVKIGKLYLKEPLGDTSNFTILTTWDKKCAYSFSSFHMADKHAAKFEGTVEEEEAE